MTKRNPSTLTEQKNVIVEVLMSKQLREKNLCGESIGILDAKGSIDYLPRDMATKDAPCDILASQVNSPSKKTKVLE